MHIPLSLLLFLKKFESNSVIGQFTQKAAVMAGVCGHI